MAFFQKNSFFHRGPRQSRGPVEIVISPPGLAAGGVPISLFWPAGRRTAFRQPRRASKKRGSQYAPIESRRSGASEKTPAAPASRAQGIDSGEKIRYTYRGG